MQRSIICSLSAFFVATLIASETYAGAAKCVAREKTPKNNRTDTEYFSRWDSNEDGHHSESAARNDYKEKYSDAPNCRNTRKLINGYFVVIKASRNNYAGELKITYAFGYGSSRAMADEDAIKELRRRDWGWKKKHGYTVDEVQKF
jgi:hypothetical protein